MSMPLISCLCVTQTGRLPRLARAVRDFQLQSYPNKQLVVVCEGHGRYHNRVSRMLRKACVDAATVFLPKRAETLGGLRNRSIELASGEYIMQWDDDDQNHYERIERQYRCLVAKKLDAIFLSDMIHYFQGPGHMPWCDWTRRGCGKPRNTLAASYIPGTILARRDILPPYPDEPKNEDILQLNQLLISDAKLGNARHIGWTHCHVCHGKNTMSDKYHRHITNPRFKIVGEAQQRLLADMPIRDSDSLTSFYRLEDLGQDHPTG